MQHRELAGHLVDRDRNVDRIANGADDVEIRQARLDHHHIRAFGDVGLRFANRLAHVRRIHLVGASIAAARRGACRFAERSVKRGGVLDGVGHDRAIDEAGLIERRSNRRDAAIHHVGGRDHIGAGARVADAPRARAAAATRRCRRPRRCRMPQWPWSVYSHKQTSAHTTSVGAAALIAVMARGDRALFIPRAAALRVLVVGNAEQQHRADTKRREISRFARRKIDRQPVVAGHRRDRRANRRALDDKQRRDQLRRRRAASRPPSRAWPPFGAAAGRDRGSGPFIASWPTSSGLR